jgi:signal transduction histidine kinase
MPRAPSRSGHPTTPKSFAPLLLAAAVLASGLGVLASFPDRLSLETRLVRGPTRAGRLVDALGVAQHDLVHGDQHRVVLTRPFESELKTVWQSNFFAESVYVTAAVDLEGDGSEEICLASIGPTRSEAVILSSNGRERLRLGPIRAVRAGPGVVWDGRLEVVAALERPAERALLCRVRTGHARAPRGVAAFDARTGDRLWFHETGVYPSDVAVADVDADGSPEVLVGSYSPDNGASVDGTDDAHSYVLALESDGTLLWKAEIGGPFSYTRAIALPGGIASPPRVAVAFRSAAAVRPEPGRVLLLDGRTGEMVARREFATGFDTPHALGDSGAFVTGSLDGAVRVFDRGLSITHRRTLGETVWVSGSGDADGDGAPEIVVSTPHDVLVLSLGLRPRARLRWETGTGLPSPVLVGRAADGRMRLALVDGRGLIADVKARPAIADPRGLGVVGALAALSGFAIPIGRRLRGLARPPAGAEAREFLLDYHQIRHETFEHERPFARIRLWAQARAAGQPLPDEMLANACEEFVRIGRPTLERFADRAAAMQVDRKRVGRIREMLRVSAEALSRAHRETEGRQEPHVREALGTIDALAVECYEAYWEVVARRPCHAEAMAAEALLAKREALDAAHVRVTFDSEPEARQPVLFDPDELRALVGELTENAARALAGVPRPTLSMAVAEHAHDPRRIVVSMRDNGLGLQPTGAGPGRPGGGFGLERARETARRWLADLTIESPSEGRGLEVRLTLRVCHVLDYDRAERRQEVGA